MPKFKYSAKDKDIKSVYGVVEYADEDEAVVGLQTKGLVVISVKKEQKRAAARLAKRKLRHRIRAEDLIFFCRQLTTLLNAGVTLLRSLNILLREINSKPLYEAVNKIRIDVEEGHTLHDAMARHPKIFQPLWISLVETGEASGQLALAFEHLVSYLERINNVMRKVKSALVYPIILVAVCVTAILVFTLKVIPMFAEVYKGFNIELPGLTVAVISVSKFMQRYLIFIILAAVGTVFFFKNVVLKTRGGRYFFDSLKLKIPLFGVLIQSSIIERFAHGLGTLIKSGVSILTGLDIIARTCGNKLFEDTLQLVKEDVRSGKAMSRPLEESGLFPPIVTQMISVGEETGKLSEMLDRVAIYYQEEMDALVSAMTSAFEPILLIFMGATVGVLVIAMYLPIFKIAAGAVAQ